MLDIFTPRCSASAWYSACWRALPLNRLRTTTKKIGTKNTARKVPTTMPEITPVPMARWLAELAPEAMASGTTPKMKASEVMTIGRKRRWAAASADSMTPLPCACRSLANSMIKMAFLADKPMMVISPTWKYTSFVMPRRVIPSSTPSTPRGTTRMTDSGIDQLSYSAAKHKNTARMAKPYSTMACEPASFSSRD